MAPARLLKYAVLPQKIAGEIQHNRHYRTLPVWPDAARIRSFLAGQKADAARIRPLAESLIEIVKQVVDVFDSD